MILRLRRAAIEMGFIIFLFYSNLLMGEFLRSNEHHKTLWYALCDIFTGKNFIIAVVAAFLGYGFFESLRKNLEI